MLITLALVVLQTMAAGVSVEKFTVSRDDSVYECFPSLTKLKNGRIILTYRESEGHVPKGFSRLIVRTSDDNGKTFSERQIIADQKVGERRAAGR